LQNTPAHTTNGKLERGLSLTQATAINMIDMVGIGPFITIPIVAGLMHGPASILAWLAGALLAYTDGMVWAELGAQWPEAGGSYVFLQKLFGKWGKLMAFLFIWQTVIQAPLVVASGAIGFSQYFTYLVPMEVWQQKALSGGVVILVTALLYRNIKTIGKISILLWIITVGTILWLIVSGIGKVNLSHAVSFSIAGFDTNTLFFIALGQASLKAVYSYLGYYNVCHLGAEIKDPAKNIPRSILLSVTGIAILYLAMQTVMVGILPSQTLANSEHAVSLYFEQLYNPTIATVATILILCIALSSLFAVVLGYSRIPYAAAQNGDFFAIFGRVHKKYHFPHISLLFLGGLGFIFSLLFKMKDVLTAIVVVRILIQFVSQGIGVIAWHLRNRRDRAYNMPLFPIPVIISLIIWLFILFTSQLSFIMLALGIILSGVALYFVRSFFVKSV
jgi:amino acid transporter